MSHPETFLLAPLSRTDSAALAQRRRGRNWAILLALITLAALFYAISVVKFLAAGVAGH
jgi:hypothetical protein